MKIDTVNFNIYFSFKFYFIIFIDGLIINIIDL